MRWRLAAVAAVGWSVPFRGLVEGSDHDKFQANAPTQTSAQGYLFGGSSGSFGASPTRSLAAATQTCEQVHAGGRLGPLRIGWDVANADSLDTELVTLVNTIMTRASRYWSSALQVFQTSEPLRASREGSGCSKFAFDSGYSCRGSVRPQCGTDGLQIPDKYLKSMRTCGERCSPTYTCTGSCVVGGTCSCNVDTWSSQKQSYCCSVASSTKNAMCPSDCSLDTVLFVGRGTTNSGTGGVICEGSCTSTPEGAGAADEDVHLFVTVQDTSSCASSSSLLAYASWCVKDQCDRPIFATINFCKSHLSKANADLSPQVNTAIHEMAHALAFSSSLYPYFRNADGSPLMARSANDPDNFPGSVRWSCNSGSVTFPDPNGNQIYKDLSGVFVNTFAERSLTSCQCPIGTGATMRAGCVLPTSGFRVPTCVVKVIMPTVKREAREHFGCSTLEGAELENQDTSECVILGSHWEQRLFNNELMAPVVTSSASIFISRVTLALFQDSGWYAVNFSWADTLTPGVSWGYKQGCNFATQKCVTGGVPVSARFYCSASGTDACSLDRTQVKRCSLSTLSGGSIPAAFDYFNGAGKIGSLAEMDYCPTYSVTLVNRNCKSSTTSSWVPYNNVNFMREVFSTSSRCFASTLHADVQNGRGTYSAADSDYASAQPVCYQVSCALGGASYVVQYSDPVSGKLMDLGTCTSDGQTLTASSLKGSVTCAPPAELCQVVPPIHLSAFAPSPANSDGASTTSGAGTTVTSLTSSTTRTTTSKTSAAGSGNTTGGSFNISAVNSSRQMVPTCMTALVGMAVIVAAWPWS